MCWCPGGCMLPRVTGAMLWTVATPKLMVVNVCSVDLWFELGFRILILTAWMLRLRVPPLVLLVVTRVVQGADPCEFPNFTALVED